MFMGVLATPLSSKLMLSSLSCCIFISFFHMRNCWYTGRLTTKIRWIRLKTYKIFKVFVFPNFPRTISFESNSKTPFLARCYLLFCDDCFTLYTCFNFNKFFSFAVLDIFRFGLKQQRVLLIFNKAHWKPYLDFKMERFCENS